ncbi:MAG: WPE palindromic element domain-containing protein [Wolbachia sp.]
MLVCLLTSKLSWIPVSEHWDDILLVENVRTVVHHTLE